MPDAKSEIDSLMKDAGFLRDYRAATHGGHSDEAGREAHARKTAAIERMQGLYARKSVEDRAAETELQASTLAKHRERTEIRTLMSSEAYRDRKHPEHESAVARVAGRYGQGAT